MAARRTLKVRSVSAMPSIVADDPAMQQGLDKVIATLRRVESTRSRDVITVDLAVGINRIRHGLGRAVAGYSITPTVADATFAHAIDTSNTRPDLEVWIEVVGVNQPSATLEVF